VQVQLAEQAHQPVQQALVRLCPAEFDEIAEVERRLHAGARQLAQLLLAQGLQGSRPRMSRRAKSAKIASSARGTPSSSQITVTGSG
jgi:hypothetical protein